jgi:hypothetical protein
MSLGISARTVTNIYARETPDGIADTTLSKLAGYLELSEPELLAVWRDGVKDRPPVPAPKPPKKPKSKGKR